MLLPCLDEAATVAACVVSAQRFLAAAGVDGEVLVADNGSEDGSAARARAAGARVVDVRTRGYGAAIVGGVVAARGRYVIMADADGSYDLVHLGPLLERLRAGDDLVVGNRFRGGIAPGAMPWAHRHLGNPALTAVGRALFGSPVHDFHCGLRGFDRARILGLGLTSTGMELATEMIARASQVGLRISEVPTTLVPDGRGRRPHLRPVRDGLRHVRLMLRLARQGPGTNSPGAAPTSSRQT